MMTYILLVLGFVFLIKGADLLVDGSSAIAKRMGVSDIVIGLTIVSLGTSAPELLVNVIASVKGNADIGMGNILGSNISNIFLILGISALIYPLKVKTNTTWKEIPLNLIAAIVLLVMANDVFLDGASAPFISRTDGIILMIFFLLFMQYAMGLALSDKSEEKHTSKLPLWRSTLYVILGVVGLAYGGQWVVNGSIEIAEAFGLNEVLIGLTIVAVGTSLPELATSAIAAYKKNTDIAIGNVVGSNLFNVFWVLGLSATIRPIPFNPIVNTDIIVFLVATLLLFVFCFTGKKYQVDRFEGGLFVFAYILYVIFLVMRG